jgi:hypothetical protein
VSNYFRLRRKVYRNSNACETIGAIEFEGAAVLKKTQIIRPTIVAAIMTFLVTMVITYVNLGLPPDFLRRWMIAWAVAWPVATVGAFIAIPAADRLTARIVALLD